MSAGPPKKNGGQRAKNRNGHLDQFPAERSVTPWEIAVLERARNTALYDYAERRLRDQEKRNDEMFWSKFGAYEASEISKRRQNRNKKSPTRMERWEQLDEERRDRAVRFGLTADDDAIKREERMRRRAERFGLDKDDSNEPAQPEPSEDKEDFLGAVRMLKTNKSLGDYAKNLERLEKRRARFAQEPREDIHYDSGWKSEVGTLSSIDPRNEERILARQKRFAQHPQNPSTAKQENTDDGRTDKSPRGRRPAPRQNENQKQQKSQSVDRRQGHQPTKWEETEPVEQQWELDGEQWPSGDQSGVQSSQQWETHGEDWSTVDQEVERNMDNEGLPPDKIVVSALGSRTYRESDVEMRYTQTWEEKGQEWPEAPNTAEDDRNAEIGQRVRSDVEMRDTKAREEEGQEWPEQHTSAQDDQNAQVQEIGNHNTVTRMGQRSRKGQGKSIDAVLNKPASGNASGLQSREDKGESW